MSICKRNDHSIGENSTWGAPRIHGELLMLGFDVSEGTVSRWINPESGALFVATSTSNNVAVLRMLPEMVISASEDDGMLFRQRFKPVAYSVEFLNFVQDCNRMHVYAPFLRVQGEKTSGG